jgi:CheY-like chemotaxis protein
MLIKFVAHITPGVYQLKILMAEDDNDTCWSYRRALEQRGHTVEIVTDGKECLDVYHKEFRKITSNVRTIRAHTLPFDVVLLDYKMPHINGMEVAKEILTINPRQRIIFASAYVKETLVESVKQLKQVVEVLQKPFGLDVLIDQIEDEEIYSELQSLNVDIKTIKAAELRHEQLKELLETLRDIQKRRIF